VRQMRILASAMGAAEMIPCSRRDRITVYCVQTVVVVFLLFMAALIATGNA
jgi:hypothetical protein